MNKYNFIFTSVILFLISFSALGTDYVSGKKVFIEGYDPVSYHTKSEAVKGSKKITYTYDGVKVQFENEKNKKVFTRNPEKYMPAYKGWCAYAMAQNGKLVKINPKSFKVIKGKTYLFYNGFFGNTLKKWNKKEIIPQVTAADSYWSSTHK